MSFNPDNPTCQPENFQPSNFTVYQIDRAREATITTLNNNNFVVGQQVRLNIPRPYGMQQINGQGPLVTSIISPVQFTINLDTRTYDAFVQFPTYPGKTPPQVNAIGDQNLTNSSPLNNGETIEGAFMNISNI